MFGNGIGECCRKAFFVNLKEHSVGIYVQPLSQNNKGSLLQ